MFSSQKSVLHRCFLKHSKTREVFREKIPNLRIPLERDEGCSHLLLPGTSRSWNPASIRPERTEFPFFPTFPAVPKEQGAGREKPGIHPQIPAHPRGKNGRKTAPNLGFSLKSGGFWGGNPGNGVTKTGSRHRWNSKGAASSQSSAHPTPPGNDPKSLWAPGYRDRHRPPPPGAPQTPPKSSFSKVFPSQTHPRSLKPNDPPQKSRSARKKEVFPLFPLFSRLPKISQALTARSGPLFPPFPELRALPKPFPSSGGEESLPPAHHPKERRSGIGTI